MRSHPAPSGRQHGAALVEFALVALLFFTLLFGVLELGRMLYIINTMQEVTRRAAREAVVRWTTEQATVKTLALFGGSAIPAGAEVTSGNIVIEYLNKAGELVTAPPEDPGDNLSACNDVTRAASCIYSVRVYISGVTYTPMLSMFANFHITTTGHYASVTMHSESMGFAPE